MNMKTNPKKMILTALLAALTCAATMSVRIPVIGTQGYIHPGDALVILSGIFLGPFYGFLAGGIGSCLADLLGGYLLYVPATFLIKGMISLLCGLCARRFSAGTHHRYVAAAGGIIDIILVSGGYFLYESVIFGAKTALFSVPSNLIQGAGGLIIAVILFPVLTKVLREI